MMDGVRPSADLREIVDSATGRKARTKKDDGPSPREIEAAVAAFAKRLSWSMKVKGQHSSGISYDQLLEYLADQGRDFLADSKRLHEHVRVKLLEDLGDMKRVPGKGLLTRYAQLAIIEWIVLRLEMGQRDVPIKKNDPAYRKWKRRHGLYTREGMATGELRNAIRDKARVKIEGP